MKKPLLKKLNLWDIAVLTLVLFGQAIYASTIIFLTSQGQGNPELTETSSAQNFQLLLFQGALLILALGYLYFRRFDFRQWHFSVSVRSTLTAIGLFIGLSLLMDALFFLFDPNFRTYVTSSPWQITSGFLSILSQFNNVSLLLYALLNGVYEELYFVGICTAVSDKWRSLVFASSLLVRIAFHTYQGLLSALGIGLLLGFAYYYWYQKKSSNLYPIFLSHAIADVIGLSLIRYLM